ncbi:hypothetical protein AAZX31_05G218400 [Glycine max]
MLVYFLFFSLEQINLCVTQNFFTPLAVPSVKRLIFYTDNSRMIIRSDNRS